MWDFLSGLGDSISGGFSNLGSMFGNLFGGGAGGGGLSSVYANSDLGGDIGGYSAPVMDYAESAGGFPDSGLSAFRALDRSIPNLSEGYYQGFLNGAEGNYGNAFQAINQQRWTVDPFNIPLRNAEHGLFSQTMWNSPGLTGVAGKIGTPFTVPGYTAFKWGVQQMPWLSKPVNALFGEQYDLTQATPASWDEMWWGLRPFWGKN